MIRWAPTNNTKAVLERVYGIIRHRMITVEADCAEAPFDWGQSVATDLAYARQNR